MTSADRDNLLVLAIDTSSAQGALGLLLGERLLGERSIPVERTFSEKLLPTIDGLLHTSGVSLGDLGLVAAVRGPGSFTGLRIGLATAKGLAYTKGVPVVGIVSLEVLAWGVGVAGERVTAVLPARPGWVYTATYRRSGTYLECLCPPELKSLDRWMGVLAPGERLVGEGALRHQALLKEVLPQVRIEPEGSHHRPRGESVARLGRCRFLDSGGLPVESLTPLYLQPSLAELRRQDRPDSNTDPGK